MYLCWWYNCEFFYVKNTKTCVARKYVDYKIEGVIFDANTKYEGLVTTIATQLGVDTIIYDLIFEFVVSAQSLPMKIHNDMGVHVYLDVKKYI